MVPKKSLSAKSFAPADDLGSSTIESFLRQHNQQDMLRFVTCGSVDDGKSTLIGRLLWESHQLFDDQIAVLADDSKRFGTQGDSLDFALLVDGLAAEREQGITIDVAYRYFSSARRKFIVADSPGHEQYTRNMVTAASTAHVAILLVDARKGVLTQTRRHAYLVSLMGIRHVVLAINKMDLVSYSPTIFHNLESEFRSFATPLRFLSITAIPLSALRGDNITERSSSSPWYSGPTLMGYLDTVQPNENSSTRLVLPVQLVCRPNASFRGFGGFVAEGRLETGNKVRVTSSGKTASVKEILSLAGPCSVANVGDPVMLVLDSEIDVSRGDILSSDTAPLDSTDQFEATIVWLYEDKGYLGRTYDIKLSTQWASASITEIKYRINPDTLGHEPSKDIGLNEIVVCNISTSRRLVFDIYESSRTLGAFVLVDRYSHGTVAAGMIRHTLRRSDNIHRQALTITRLDREQLNGHKGMVIWLTGLSGSGKSTIANALEMELHAQGRRTYILDGDNVRHGLNKDLGFTDADRVENIRRIAEVAKLMMDAGLIVITAFISPFQREREAAREIIGVGCFAEVYVATPLEVCEQRDVKGLYKKARRGEIPNMTGISSPYEVPTSPEIVVSGTGDSTREAIRAITDLLYSDSNYLRPASGG